MFSFMLSFLGLVPTFQKSKCKKLLSTTMKRIKLLKCRREAQLRQLCMDVAQLLKLNKEQKARVWLARIWKERCLLSVYVEIAEYCHSVETNLKDIAEQSECPSNMEEPLAGLCFAASCCADLPELQELREIFSMKYGKNFVTSAQELHADCHVNQKFLDYFCVTDPSDKQKMELLEEIAAQTSAQDNKQEEIHEPSSTEVSVDADDCNQAQVQHEEIHHTTSDLEDEDDKDEIGSEKLQEMDVMQEMDHTVTVCDEDMGSAELANRKRTSEGRQSRRSKFKRAFRKKLAAWENKDTQEKGNAKVHACMDEAPNEDQLIILYVEEPSFSMPPQRPPPPPPPPKRVPPLPSSLPAVSTTTSHHKQANADNFLPLRCSAMRANHFIESHVHPKLPEYEDFVAKLSARKRVTV